jgi:hypothetical protein
MKHLILALLVVALSACAHTERVQVTPPNTPIPGIPIDVGSGRNGPDNPNF